MEGWIKLYKKFKKWGWYHSSQMVHLFIHLLLSANHQDKEWQGIIIKRGQLVTGLSSLNKSTGISAQSLRTCLTRLKSTSEITIKSTNKYSIITLVKYEQYQSKDILLTGKSTGKLTNNQQTTNKQLTTTKEYKNIRSKENTYDEKSSGQFFIKSMPINLEDLNDEDITYEEEYVKTPKKYKGRTKAYTRIAIKYLQLRGEAGDVLRYFKDIKELWELAEKSVKPEKVEAEIIGRIEVMKKYAEIEKISWGLGAVVKNWNAILKDYSKKVQL